MNIDYDSIWLQDEIRMVVKFRFKTMKNQKLSTMLYYRSFSQ